MDRIYEAYVGDLGNTFAEKTKKRIHWICDKVQGEKILDVGCSQGITAILLARKGLQVTGLDISEETVACARKYLLEESEEVQARVDFRQTDFTSFSSATLYDTVIMGEVLEHLLHPQTFVANAQKLLTENGRLIVTVPFGINDAPDHKQTFFYFEIVHLLERYFLVSEMQYFGKWIGFVATKVKDPVARDVYEYEECLQVEQAFYQIERQHLNERAALKEKVLKNNSAIQDLQKKVKEAATNYQTAAKQIKDQNQTIEQYKGCNQELEKTLETTTKHNEELEHALETTTKCNEELERALATANKTAHDLEAALSEAIQDKLTCIQKLDSDNQELSDTLNSLQMELTECNRMLKKARSEKMTIEKKYESLSRSKLGRLTLWYWSLRKGKR